jgi:hypothetical protein
MDSEIDKEIQRIGIGPPKFPENAKGHKGLAKVITYLIEMKAYNTYRESTDQNKK